MRFANYKAGRKSRVAEADALEHIAGFTAANDVTMRDHQYKTPGDRMHVKIEGIGTLDNEVVAEHVA